MWPGSHQHREGLIPLVNTRNSVASIGARYDVTTPGAIDQRRDLSTIACTLANPPMDPQCDE